MNQQTAATPALRDEIAAVGFWWHSIDLAGVVTPGGKSAARLAQEWAAMDVPDLTGKSVLDIGAWDGYFSFRAEQAGAREVVALDHYVWSIDREGRAALHQQHVNAGGLSPAVETTPCWRPDTLPGKRGFDLARRVLGSRARPLVGDYLQMDAAAIGTHDVVFYLGVLYHMPNPLQAMEQLARLTRELAIIETHAVAVHGHDAPLAEFYPGTELNGDPSNWWGPNIAALVGLCKAAGFKRVEVRRGPPAYGALRGFALRLAALLGLRWGKRHRHYRAIVHAWK